MKKYEREKVVKAIVKTMNYIPKVGDVVSFTVNREAFEDTVIYVGEGRIEGEQYDLTYFNLTKVEK